MKTVIASRAAVGARIGPTIVAFALISCAPDDLSGALEGASLPTQTPTMSAASVGGQQCAGHTSTHTLFLKDADGNAFQLVYFVDCGWKCVPGARAIGGESNLGAQEMGFSSIPTAQAEKMATPIEDPRPVFIDGPTGYTFIWTSDAGWKFAGYVTDQKQPFQIQ